MLYTTILLYIEKYISQFKPLLHATLDGIEIKTCFLKGNKEINPVHHVQGVPSFPLRIKFALISKYDFYFAIYNS